MHSENNSLKYSGNERFAQVWITPFQDRSSATGLWDVQWFGYQHPWNFTGCLETPAPDLPSVIALSQLPSGADAPTCSHRTSPPPKCLPKRGPSTSSSNPSALVSDGKGSLGPWRGPAVGWVCWEWKMREKKKREYCWSLGESPK